MSHAASAKPASRCPSNPDRICDTDFEIDHYQPIYSILESFEQLRDAMNRYAEQVLGEPVGTAR